MAVYINYGEGEADATVQGAEWLQTVIESQRGPEAQKQFLDNFKKFYVDAEERTYDSGLVFDLFLDHCSDLFGAIPEARAEERMKDVESFFALVFSTLHLLDEAEHVDRGTTRLCQILAESKQQHPELRLRLLMSLYNTFPPTLEFRYRVFKYTIDYAAEAGLFDQVAPYLEYLDAWMADWSAHLTVEDKRTLYCDISEHLRNLGKRVDAFQHLKTYHQLLQGSSADALKEAKVQAASVQLLVDAIQIPSVVLFDDILGFDSVKAVSKGAEAGLVKVCEVFYDGTVEDLVSFHKKNEALFQKHGLDFQEALTKIKLLALATMARSRTEISLVEVAQSLGEPEDDIERWVVRAISEGLIDGRIDQLHSKVLVKSAFQRKFEKDEWAFLDAKLSAWTDNLESVLKFIGEQKEQKAAKDASPTAAAN